MKVKFVYRNYKPLHQIYEPLVQNPPAGVEYIVTPPKSNLIKLYPLSKKLRYFAPTRYVIHAVEKVVFLSKPDEDDNDVDIYHYINIIDSFIPAKPYVVDIEHAASLTTFTHHKRRLKKVKAFLSHDNCKSITCLSQAAKRTLTELLGPDFSTVEQKVNVIYPALQKLDEGKKADHSIIDNSKQTLKVLFVGNQAYLKGLEELLIAIKQISEETGPNKIKLYAISNDAEVLFKKYPLPNARLFPPNFSKDEIIQKFFMAADVFVMPTKEDTFGMAILDAMVCGTPIISTKQFALPELVTESEDGVLLEGEYLLDQKLIPSLGDMTELNNSNVNPQLTEKLKNTLESFIRDRKKLEKMKGKGAEKFAAGQKFATDTRNKSLIDVYNRALGI